MRNGRLVTPGSGAVLSRRPAGLIRGAAAAEPERRPRLAPSGGQGGLQAYHCGRTILCRAGVICDAAVAESECRLRVHFPPSTWASSRASREGSHRVKNPHEAGAAPTDPSHSISPPQAAVAHGHQGARPTTRRRRDSELEGQRPVTGPAGRRADGSESAREADDVVRGVGDRRHAVGRNRHRYSCGRTPVPVQLRGGTFTPSEAPCPASPWQPSYPAGDGWAGARSKSRWQLGSLPQARRPS